MQSARDWLRRDPGSALLLLALVAGSLLFAPTVSRGLVNYDDYWLIRDNVLLQDVDPSTIFLDLSPETRFALGAEYLPVRDLSIALDYAIWEDFYAGFHLTSILLYLLAIVLWFKVLVELGIDRVTAGLAILLWTLHPSHAEAVAWLSERKGLLAVVWAGCAALGYARFRSGRGAGWLAFAMVATVLAVWSKAPAAASIAVLALLELVVPVGRHSWRRSLVGLGSIAVVGALAFAPVVMTALDMRVVTASGAASATSVSTVLGIHGAYLQLAAMTFRNAVSYPIATLGPSTLDIVIGAVGLAAVIACIATRRAPTTLRVAACVWLAGWLPASRVLLPMTATYVADRYLLFASLGFALAVAFALLRLRTSRLRTLLIGAVVIAAALRTLDAQSNWRDSVTLWQRAVVSNPSDGAAWSFYVEALEDAGEKELAYEALARGLRNSRAPRLLLRKALLTLARGERDDAMRTMRDAAVAGEPRAMSNLAIMLFEAGQRDEALEWARKAVAAAPMYAKGYRTLGGVARAMNHHDEALAAFRRATLLAPAECEYRVELAVTLLARGHRSEPRRLLEACRADKHFSVRVERLLASLPEQEAGSNQQ